MDEQTAKHLVKIMEGMQKDLHVIASNKEVLNLKLDTKGKDIAEAISSHLNEHHLT